MKGLDACWNIGSFQEIESNSGVAVKSAHKGVGEKDYLTEEKLQNVMKDQSL
jgi:hypothetical protein